MPLRVGGRSAPPTRSAKNNERENRQSGNWLFGTLLVLMATVAEPSSRKLDDLQKLVALCKRRGFVFPSAEIYGGFANTYDYCPLGTLLKNNVRDDWIRANIQRRDDV